MRFFDNIRPFIWMKPISDALYEVVYLQGHPALTASNSNDPPGSFHSRDVFTPHPTMADRWKYVSRLDDRITLVNGEKVLPLPIEGCIKQNPLIQEAVVVGVDKAVPGLLVFRTDSAQMFSDADFVDLIWPTVEDANSRAEQFAQIARDMILVLPADAVCPRTDKGSMIRAQVYTKYADAIEHMYTTLEQTVDGTLQLDLPATEKHLIKLCHEDLGFPVSSPRADLFAEGLDSLKAIHLRRLILKHFKVPDAMSIRHNLVFETGNIARLAEHILALQSGHAETPEDEVALMPGLIAKYSVFQSHTPRPSLVTSHKSVVRCLHPDNPPITANPHSFSPEQPDPSVPTLSTSSSTTTPSPSSTA